MYWLTIVKCRFSLYESFIFGERNMSQAALHFVLVTDRWRNPTLNYSFVNIFACLWPSFLISRSPRVAFIALRFRTTDLDMCAKNAQKFYENARSRKRSGSRKFICTLDLLHQKLDRGWIYCPEANKRNRLLFPIQHFLCCLRRHQNVAGSKNLMFVN